MIHGNLGSFHKSRGDIQEAELKKFVIPGSIEWGKEPESQQGILNVIRDGETLRKLVPTENGNYGIYYTRLYEALRNNAPLPVTAEEGRNVIDIIERPIKSVHENESSHAEEPGENSIVVASACGAHSSALRNDRIKSMGSR